MSKTKSKKTRLKMERAGGINPEMLRVEWNRKPQTQVNPNIKAEQRRSHCRRKGSSDGAEFFSPECIVIPRSLFPLSTRNAS